MKPINSFVIKIASRCNLNCSYCYEYNMGDNTWKKASKVLEIEALRKILENIIEHSNYHEFDNVDISLHGGEPLLVGIKLFKKYIYLIKNELKDLNYTIGLQSNGLLITDEFLDFFKEEAISIGISCDGPPKVNDKNRYYHNGKGSGLKLEKVLYKLQNNNIFAGILAVIDITENPLEVWHYLASFSPPVVDFLLPHGHHDKLPQKKTFENKIYGDWMIKIFDDWFAKRVHQEIRIRFFEEIIYRL